MPFTNLMRDRSREQYRSGRVFAIEDDGGTETAHDFGKISDLTIEVEPVTQSEDTEGRTSQLAVNITVEFTMQQTSLMDFNAIADLLDLDADIAITARNTEEANVLTEAEFRFANVALNSSGSLSYNGTDESTIMVNFQGTVGLDSWQEFLDDTSTALVLGS
jgi:hypothetical protein